ncbi:hypothetical protein L0Z72_08530 [candidate division KSB1 bacterium]|jgi:uncharacterized protein YgfB (UPF0149 family)|nr:hypothetical protein [candidate division KSB1 bacterium]
MPFLDDLAKLFKKGITVVAKKTDEYTKIGKIKVEIIGIKRDIEKRFSELGGRTFQLIAEENNTKVAANEEVKSIIEAIKQLNEKLGLKKAELDQVRLEYGQQPEDIEDITAEEVSDDGKAKG